MPGEFFDPTGAAAPHKCEKPDTRYTASGTGWRCECGKAYVLKTVDYGHDVQNGESPVGYRWERLPSMDAPFRPDTLTVKD
jgi:hypothetical protein